MRLPGAPRGLRTRQKSLLSVVRSQRCVSTFNAAVIGGGITGLAAAWDLSRNPSCSGVTLYEKSPRLGGWLQSEKVAVDGGDILIEHGPRTLRSAFPTSLPLLSLIAEVGLFDELITTSKQSPAARNRFIYYPDHLVQLPVAERSLSLSQNIERFIHTIWREPLFNGVLPGILFEHWKPPRNATEWQKDESIGSFISRRFHPNIAENLLSAVMHGIYAGDIDQLSAQMLMGAYRNLEDGGVLYGLVSKGLAKRKTYLMDDLMAWESMSNGIKTKDRGRQIGRVLETASTFTLKGGTQQLVDGLAAALKASPKVSIMTNTNIDAMSQSKGADNINIQSREHGHRTYDHVIATLPAPALAKILTPTNHPNQVVPHSTIEKLQLHDYATTVMVVNLYYSNPNLLPVEGFGYLIPRSVPVDQNPECGLGVIFASSSSVGQSASPPHHDVSQDTAPGTKLTVMFGGHYWDGWKETDYPDHDSAVRMARTMLQRHLGITDAPAVARSRLQRDAIPQYTVGHLDRMYDLSTTVRTDFNSRLVLAGNWYNGVGVGDCVRQGILAANVGVGMTLVDGARWAPWLEYNYRDWDLQGGIPTAPIRLVDGPPYESIMPHYTLDGSTKE